MVIEGVSRDIGVAVEIALCSDLGLGAVNPERQDRQCEIDDPNPKILATRTAKFKRIFSGGRHRARRH